LSELFLRAAAKKRVRKARRDEGRATPEYKAANSRIKNEKFVSPWPYQMAKSVKLAPK
jgi:hypothetical protein